jgi:hypothetical protein
VSLKLGTDNTCSIDVLLKRETANIPLQLTTNSDTSLSFDAGDEFRKLGCLSSGIHQ